MTFVDRIAAVLSGGPPDRVPVAPYDNLVPRGDFERELRNRGMGLCLRRSAVWSETADIAVEHKTEGNVSYTIYHTPWGRCARPVARTWGVSPTVRAFRRNG
jgi:hypothetical protein